MDELFLPAIERTLGFNDIKQTEMHTAGPSVPEVSAFEFELAIEKLKSHKSPGTDQIQTEMITSGRRKFRYEIHKLIISIWKKAEFPEEWKDSITVPIYKNNDKTDCNNYRDTSLLPTTYKILFNILLSRLTPYAEEIIGVH